MNDYHVVRTNRKTLAVEVTRELEVVVRAPFYVSQSQIEQFVNAHKKWIERAKQRVSERQKNFTQPTAEEIACLKKEAREYVLPKVCEFGKMMGLEPSAVKITSARTRFGSCSAKNSICFSCLLMRYPQEAVDYVIVHELAHIKHKNHGKQFYRLIEKYMPDYRERNRLLKSSPDTEKK